MKFVKGDKVLIIAGKEKGKEGVIERVMPKYHKVIVSGHNLVKKHLKRNNKFPQGGVVEISAPINASNVMLLDPRDNKPTRKRTDVPKPTIKRGSAKAKKEDK